MNKIRGGGDKKIIKRFSRSVLPVMLALSMTAGGTAHFPVWAEDIVLDPESTVTDDVSSDPGSDAQTIDGTTDYDDGSLTSDMSDLFVDTGEDKVVRKGETLDDARSEDEALSGYGDGGSTINIGHLYVINGVKVRNSDFPSEHNECWAYANNIYAKIWGYNFWSDFNGADNMLRNLSDEELTLTPEHLKAYVSAAPAGSALRICNEDYLHANDIGGHSQIIISHDEDGFTVFEGGLSAFPHRREAYYTWTGYCYSGWPGKYHYIKYIKWPGAEPYTEGLIGNNAQDLGESEIDRMQSEINKRFREVMTIVGHLITGEASSKEMKQLEDAADRVILQQEPETESELSQQE